MGLLFPLQDLESSMQSPSRFEISPPAILGLPPGPSIPSSHPQGHRTPGFWSNSSKMHPQLFFRLCSHCFLGWGPSRLIGNAIFPLAAFADSSGGINCHLCSHCPCKHSGASKATHLLRLFYLSRFPTAALKCLDNGNYLIHLKLCPAHSRHIIHAC